MNNRFKKSPHGFLAALLSLFVFTALHAEDLQRREWKIDGVTREGLVHVPKGLNGTNGVPLVFVFHGHGGSMFQAAKSFHLHQEWPEALVVYLQGLNTPGHITDPEGKFPGWQRIPGDQGDRDLKLFDAVLATMKKEYHADEKRIYSTGHSNGGAFTYLLWETRGKEFAAFAPSGCATVALFGSRAERGVFLRGLKPEDKSKLEPILDKVPVTSSQFLPKPMLHIAGENDPLAKFQWQKLTIDAVRKLNECAAGKSWDADKRCTAYPSKIKSNVVTYIHPGKHNFPQEAPEMIVKFFKQQRLN